MRAMDGALLDAPLPGLDDAEGVRIPADLPEVIDAHVHLFPDAIWRAIRRWFDRHAWPVRYRMDNAAIVDFQLSRGVTHLVALHYAHRPGLAREMNRELARFCAGRTRVTGLATVFPGEDGAREILAAAFADGLAGVKLHLHVQGVAPDDPRMHDVYRACSDHGLPLVMHAGREPRSPAYPADPHAICSADRIERVLRRWPDLRLCVPHLGGDEFDAYLELMLRFDHLWLDTTMMLAGYFGYEPRWDMLAARPERVMYGTDFPSIPYAWDRELRRIANEVLDPVVLEAVLGGTARGLFGIVSPPPAG
jgi:uncharacterized protein